MEVKNLKRFRLDLGLSQKDVADVIGVTQTQYSRLERGTSLINHKQIIVLCELYKITPNDLLGFKGAMSVAIDPLFEDYKELVEKIKK